jgi:hypothetical protein
MIKQSQITFIAVILSKMKDKFKNLLQNRIDILGF